MVGEEKLKPSHYTVQLKTTELNGRVMKPVPSNIVMLTVELPPQLIEALNSFIPGLGNDAGEVIAHIIRGWIQANCGFEWMKEKGLVSRDK